MIDLKKMETEKRNKNTMDIDQKDVRGILKLINDEDKLVAYAIEKKLDEIEPLVEACIKVYSSGGRIIYTGAGTSGRLGVLDAVECPPTYGVKKDRFIGLMAGGDCAFLEAVEGAEDSYELGVEDLEKINLTNKDIVIGIAASGRTPYVISTLQYAAKVGAKTGSISINANAEISKYADFKVEVVVGPEVVTGSTRMKAGTAQKMILNMISTATMIKSGKVYQNLMVDVMPTNEKLQKRAISIIVEATQCDEVLAQEKFQEADQSVKTAIVMILNNLNKDQAQEKLKQNNNFIKKG